MNVVELKGITKEYKIRSVINSLALEGIDLTVESNDFLAILGSSGSGKTTLLNIIGGIDKPDAGTVTVCSYDLLRMSNVQLTEFRRRHLGFIFQRFHLLQDFSVIENVMIPLKILGLSYLLAKSRSMEAISNVGLEEIPNKYPSELSTGQMQRVAIARAVVSQPSLILADEPTGNLDKTNTRIVVDLLKKMSARSTVITVTHDLFVANECKHICNIEKGKLVGPS